MRKSKVFIICLNIFFQLNTLPGFGQDVVFNNENAIAWVDSVFETLSITDRVNQMLALETNGQTNPEIEFPNTLGGVIIHSAGPIGFAETQKFVQSKLLLPALVFAQLGDPLGIDIDSVIHFGSSVVLSAVSEPYLFYETGLSLASQCRTLDINGLISDKRDLFAVEKNELPWRKVELNQGISDGGTLPVNAVSFIRLEDLDLKSMLENTAPEMILIDPDSIPAFHEFIRQAVANEEIDLNAVFEKCRQILELKYRQGIRTNRSQELQNVIPKLNQAQYLLLQNELSAASLTVLKNDDDILPIKKLFNNRFASLTIGKSDNSVFEHALDDYAQVDHYNLSVNEYGSEIERLSTLLDKYDYIITAVYFREGTNSDFFQSFEFRTFIEELDAAGKAIIICFGDPYYIDKSPFLLNSGTLLAAYEDDSLGNMQIPQLVFGGRASTGVLPVSLRPGFQKGFGVNVNKVGRFDYTLPEAVGLSSKVLSRIDSIVRVAISEKAIPGCQVLVAKDNSVIYRKAFGFHTYDSLQKVRNDDLYDLASLTKVSGALPALMKLSQEGKFDLDATLGTYIRYYKRGNKKKITFREILAHQAGLQAWIPYWKTAIRRNGKFRRKTMDNVQSEKYPYEITEGLYLHKDYKKKIYKQIKKSKVGEKKYLYSGLTFYLFPEIIEVISGEKYEDYLYNNFYKPLGANTLTYNPMDRFDIDRIVPTEYDSLFRKGQIHGKVHDEGAAMMEGVSSNAGLFSDSNDLAKLFQMYCNYGEYGGQRYLEEATVKEFARCQYPENDNRRALGFDRPLPVPHENGNTAVSASQSSFGHTGFTGTFAWSDPEYNLVYIFFSNRVYPTRANTKLYDMNVRTNIQQVIYDAMFQK